MKMIDKLISQGLTNRDTGDISTIMEGASHLVRKAYCTSNQCRRTEEKDSYGNKIYLARVEKKARINQFACDECGFVLFWETQRVKGRRSEQE